MDLQRKLTMRCFAGAEAAGHGQLGLTALDGLKQRIDYVAVYVVPCTIKRG